MQQAARILRYYGRRLDTWVNGWLPRRECNVCGRRFHHFHTYRNGRGELSDFMKSVDFMTGNLRDFACPYCGATDRERHLFVFFDKLDLWRIFGQAVVLHFAPEAGLRRKILSLGPAQYVQADLFSVEPGVEKIDVMAIPYPERYFDFVFCCHVLEHVPDERAALAELWRVLKPGGQAVLQTPYSRLLTRTFQDEGVDSDALRRQFYGQEDHLRLFGRDLFDKIREAGFQLQIKAHGDLITAEETRRLGLCPEEDLILVARPTGDEAGA